jgi:hypothetical protein
MEFESYVNTIGLKYMAYADSGKKRQIWREIEPFQERWMQSILMLT